MESAEEGGEVGLGLEAGDGGKPRLQGIDPRLVDRRLVHAGGEIVADLPGVGVAAGSVRAASSSIPQRKRRLSSATLA